LKKTLAIVFYFFDFVAFFVFVFLIFFLFLKY
jgi:hypothetical protein